MEFNEQWPNLAGASCGTQSRSLEGEGSTRISKGWGTQKILLIFHRFQKFHMGHPLGEGGTVPCGNTWPPVVTVMRMASSCKKVQYFHHRETLLAGGELPSKVTWQIFKEDGVICLLNGIVTMAPHLYKKLIWLDVVAS